MGASTETHKTLCRESLNDGERPPSSWRPGNPEEEQEEKFQESEVVRDTRRIWPTKSTEQVSHGLTEVEAASMGSVGV